MYIFTFKIYKWLNCKIIQSLWKYQLTSLTNLGIFFYEDNRDKSLKFYI